MKTDSQGSATRRDSASGGQPIGDRGPTWDEWAVAVACGVWVTPLCVPLYGVGAAHLVAEVSAYAGVEMQGVCGELFAPASLLVPIAAPCPLCLEALETVRAGLRDVADGGLVARLAHWAHRHRHRRRAP